MAGGMQGGRGGGYDYPAGGPPMPPPVPIRKSGAGNGCLIAGLVGCGGFLLLTVLIGLVSYKKLSTLMATPGGRKASGGFQKMISSAIAAPKCGQSLVQIRSAIQSYQADHKNKYPPSLDALVPDYIASKSVITVGDADVRPSYTPPRAGHASAAPLVTYDLGDNALITTREASVSQQIKVVLQQDGHIFNDQIQRTEMFPQRGQESP